jgi:hypothetical protein
MAAATDWDAARVRDALSSELSRRTSIHAMGVQWVETPVSGQPAFRMDGLATLFLAVRGRIIYISNSQPMLASVLAPQTPTTGTGTTAADTYTASFRHARERASYNSLMRALDSVGGGYQTYVTLQANRPAFFSGNAGSLSTVLADIQSIDVKEQSLPDRVVQTVQYF